MFFEIRRRHRAAEGVAAYVPVGNFRKHLPYAVCGVDIEYREVKRHPDEHTKYALLGERLHERQICSVFDFSAGIEYQSLCRIFALADYISVVEFDCLGQGTAVLKPE